MHHFATEKNYEYSEQDVTKDHLFDGPLNQSFPASWSARKRSASFPKTLMIVAAATVIENRSSTPSPF